MRYARIRQRALERPIPFKKATYSSGVSLENGLYDSIVMSLKMSPGFNDNAVTFGFSAATKAAS